jgi:3-oxoacyl-[acyl-carrier protein] reductase
MAKDYVAIVTGAAGYGMGRSIALTLARDGVSVVVNYRQSRENAEAIAGYLHTTGRKAIAVQADVFDPGECKKLVDQTLEAFGKIDICIINPGGGWHPESLDQLNPSGALEDLLQEVAPYYNLTPLVLPGMRRQKWGRIIGIAVNLSKPSPAYAYNVAKAARVQAFLLSQDQVWSDGVTVNVIAPGPVHKIPTLEEAIEQCDHGNQWLSRKDVSPQDIAEGVSFLCSEAGSYITGCVIPYGFRD